MSLLIELFFAFLQVGMFSFGGGYAAMPLISSQVVTKYGWLSVSEFTDLITISQMTPGPIAVNSATFVGIKVAGIPGAVIATIGCILPSCIVVTIIAYFYMKYRHMAFLQNVLKVLKPVVVSLIGVAGLTILVSAFFGGTINLANTNYVMVVIFIISFILLRYKKMNPILVMFLAGLLNVAYTLII